MGPDHPALAAVPRVDLGVRATPTEERRIGGVTLLVKRDDLASPRYGGNKVRALEYLLARPGRRLLTFTTRSAFHGLATALHGRALGRSTSVVVLRRGRAGEALAALRTVARVREARTSVGAALFAARLWRPGTRIIPPGGMSPLGALGYLRAALELDEAPSRIYLALGTGTTASGLLAGLMLRGAETEVVAVRVVRSRFNRPAALLKRAGKAIDLLRRHDPSLPEVPRGGVRLRVVPADGEYGEPTPAATAARDAAAPLALETTYTAKALAVLLAEKADGAMFLNTWAGPVSSLDHGSDLPE